MWQEITEHRFSELRKMTNFLEKRNSVNSKWWSTMECMISGWDVVCAKTGELLCAIKQHHSGENTKFYYREPDDEYVRSYINGGRR